jgi:peptidoglycan/LPS O-acetylase OafA/YrhL
MGEVHWRAVAAQTLLLQAWLPSETESSLLPHTWFLSAIVPYWALHDTMLHLVCRLSSSKLLRLALLLCFLPWLALVLVPVALGVPLDWYAVHRWGDSGTALDVLVVFLKFHPLCYGHLYLLGVALAVLTHRKDQRATAGHSAARPYPLSPLEWVASKGAILAMPLLLMIFAIPALRPPAAKLLCRLGGLAPLQGLFLIGLSSECDPIARCLARPAAQAIGAASYPLYIVHFMAFDLWRSGGDDDASRIFFWPFLIIAAHFSLHAIHLPLANERGLNITFRAVMLVCTCSICPLSIWPYARLSRSVGLEVACLRN